MRVISKEELWGRGKLAYLAGLVGALMSCAYLLADPFLPTTWGLYPLIVLAVLLLLIAPGVVLGAFRHQIDGSFRALLAGLGFGLGSGVPSLLEVALRVISAEFGWALFALTAYFGWSVYFSLFALLGWLLLRRLRPRVIIQDGTVCPHCGYSLIGNVSQICPECGRRFECRELGTTVDQLRETAQSPLLSRDGE